MKSATNESFVENDGSSKPGLRFAVLLAIPAIVALILSAYLSYVAMTSSKIAGCGGGLFNCDHVLNSKWSTFAGIPVGLLAAGTYVTLLFAIGVVVKTRSGSRPNSISWAIINLLGVSAGLAAIWFTSIQIFLIGHLCPYCIAVHVCGLVIAGALLIRQPFSLGVSAPLAGLAASGLAVIIAVQVNSPETVPYSIERHEIMVSPSHPVNTIPGEIPVFGAPIEEDESVFDPPFDGAAVEHTKRDLMASLNGWSGFLGLLHPGLMTSVVVDHQETVSQKSANKSESVETGKSTQPADGQEKVVGERRLISIRGGSVKLDVRQWPLLGQPDAKYVFVEMFDYACPHCRKTHDAIREARKTLGDDLAIIVLPVPLNTNCNDTVRSRDAKFAESCELSRLAVACWRLDPAKFCDFHEWMFQGASAPTYANAKQQADNMIGKEALDAELAKSACNQYIAKHVELYKRVGKGSVPKLLFPGTSVEGEYSSGSNLVDLIRREAN